jgi:hypothetical protein
MITVKLLGGLGNQMFQYALGRHLATKNKTGLTLDLTSLLDRGDHIDFTFRDFELDIFDIKYSKTLKSPKSKLQSKLSTYLFPVKQVKEQNFLFSPTILQETGRIYLDGYWQCEKYFYEIRDLLLSDFSFKIQPNTENKRLLNAIGSVQSVSIHFRRGDYVSNSNANDFHGICSREYYLKAIEFIKSRVREPRFFIFSDDIDAIKSEFNFDNDFAFVDINKGSKSYEDLRLMTACKHNIIANSSFSWWGAWLNNNPEKIVTAPNTWFKNRQTDIIPQQWIQI